MTDSQFFLLLTSIYLSRIVADKWAARIAGCCAGCYLLSLLKMKPTTHTLQIPTPSGAMAPFEITADSPQDLHRQARVLFSHVWGRIVWPHGLEPKDIPRNPGPRR